MMEELCKNCANFEDGDSYDGTGYCILHRDYVKDEDSCDNFRDDY